MLVPYSWLKQFVPTLPPAQELEPLFARLGLPIEDLIEAPAPPKGVVFARVSACVAIEGTHLQTLSLDIGGREAQVVTGAPNARSGIGVALALPGAVLTALDAAPGNMGLEVGRRTLAGVESEGMACSPKELGIGEYGAGLLELPALEAAPGTPLADLWPGDIVLDVEVTPNRADALSVLGLARDLAASLNTPLVLPDFPAAGEARSDYPLSVSLQDPGCDHFVARVATGVNNGPSPAWMQRRLNLAGHRAINALVDASNYVMLELGQPTAVYDLSDLPERQLVVRAARIGEQTVTLDDVERTLDESDLVIATPERGASRIVGLAGVMGAKYSSITQRTTAVGLEAAHFDPVRLRLSARRLGLATDAVYRFERGVDPNLPRLAADRFMQLVAQTTGAAVEPGCFQAGAEQIPPSIPLSLEELNSLLGASFAAADVTGALERLGCVVDGPAGGPWRVRPPSARVDLTIAQDLIEEAARMLGYDQLPETLPNLPPVAGLEGTNRAPIRVKRTLKDTLAGMGFQEIVSYSFTNPAEAEAARAPAPGLMLKNPQSSERTALRTVLYPGLLNAARINRAEERLLLFEVGRVFPSLEREEERLGILQSGPVLAGSWNAKARLDGGYFALKGLLESVAARLGDRLEVKPFSEAPAALHPGASGELLWNGFSVGELGVLHPAVAEAWGLPPSTTIAELQLPLPGRPWSFIDPSRHPAALRDLAVIAPDRVTYADLRALVADAAGMLVESVTPFDVYRGAPVPEGSRSVALHLRFRAPGRTLTDTEVDDCMNRVMGAIRASGYAIRD